MRRLRDQAHRRFMSAADCSRDARQWPAAVASYSQAVACFPEHAAAWVQLGHALKETGSLERALAAYQNAAEIDPESADTCVQLGHVYKLMKRYCEAVAAYERACRLDPLQMDAEAELAWLGHAPGFDAIRAYLGEPSPNRRMGSNADGEIVFDVSDLVYYVLDNYTPSGIQRVQLELATAIRERGDDRIHLAAYVPWNRQWIPIHPRLVQLIDDGILSGRLPEVAPADVIRRFIEYQLRMSEPFTFLFSDRLVPLGGTWALPHYMERVRDLKRTLGIRYFPLLYDLAPLDLPDRFQANVAVEFEAWFSSALRLADGWLCASNTTLASLKEKAAMRGGALGRAWSIGLGARGRWSAVSSHPRNDAPFDLPDSPFVLFVSTFEPRKGHILAFEA